MAKLKKLISLEEALKCKTISDWTFCEAITGHDWFKEPLLSTEDIDSFKLNEKNKYKIYELVKKFKEYYQKNSEKKFRKNYDYRFDEIDMAFEFGGLKEQEEAIRGLLTTIVTKN